MFTFYNIIIKKNTQWGGGRGASILKSMLLPPSPLLVLVHTNSGHSQKGRSCIRKALSVWENMLFPVCGRVATCLNYLTTIIFQVAVETISYSSGESNGKCLRNLLCHSNSSCVQHCNVFAGSRCSAVSLHVILQQYKVMYWTSLSKSCTNDI